MSMWHITQKLFPLVGLSLKGIIRDGGGQGGAHKVRGWVKLTLPVGSYLVWKGGLHGDLCGMIATVGGWVE